MTTVEFAKLGEVDSLREDAYGREYPIKEAFPPANPSVRA